MCALLLAIVPDLILYREHNGITRFFVCACECNACSSLYLLKPFAANFFGKQISNLTERRQT